MRLERQLFLDGTWRPASSRATGVVTNPAGGEAGVTALAGPDDVEAAARAAAPGAAAWRALGPEGRGGVLRRAAASLEASDEELARQLTAEQGKPLPDARKEVRFAARVFRYYAEEGERVWGTLRLASQPDVRSMVTWEPRGLVGAIVPWNYPVDLYAWKVAPALAAGCAVIAKPPADAPFAVGGVVRALAEAGLPRGALADLPGGPEVGAAIVRHPAVVAVAATASVATGRAIAAAAAPGLKHVALELGGHSPFVVLEDADIELAAAAAVRRSFSNMGQICIAVNRVLVAERRRAAFVEAVVERTRALRLGPGLADGVEYGPMFDEVARARAEGHLADAVQRGATLLVGGRRPTGEEFADGVFLEPAVLDRVPLEARAMTEETFGPLLPIATGREDGELLAMANALPYGLAAYVYSEDLERGWAFAERLEAGGVGINVNDVTELQAPFGDWKLSGTARDLGPEGLRTFLQTRHLRARLRPLGETGPGGGGR